MVVGESEEDRLGEIDLIAIDRRSNTIVFVEVKTLATTKPGHPAERVDEAKQARITRAAMRYLKRKQLLGIAARFDVVAVWWPSDQDPLPRANRTLRSRVRSTRTVSDVRLTQSVFDSNVSASRSKGFAVKPVTGWSLHMSPLQPDGLV